MPFLRIFKKNSRFFAGLVPLTSAPNTYSFCFLVINIVKLLFCIDVGFTFFKFLSSNSFSKLSNLRSNEKISLCLFADKTFEKAIVWSLILNFRYSHLNLIIFYLFTIELVLFLQLRFSFFEDIHR